MKLSDIDLLHELERGDLEISSLDDIIPPIEDQDDVKEFIQNNKQIQPASVDLRLKGELKKYDNPERIDLKNIPEPDRKETGEKLVLKPDDFALATTKERIYIPPYLSSEVRGRSSIGRAGFHIHTAGWIDPGYKGEITLELANHTSKPIDLYEGMRICQITFTELKNPCVVSYGEKDDAKYQNQRGATASKIDQDFD